MTKNIYAKIERIVEDADKCKKQLEILEDMLENAGKDALILRMDKDDKFVTGMIIEDPDIVKNLLLTLQSRLYDKLENLRYELRETI